MPETWETYLTEHEPRHLDELQAFLRFPSISALPQHRGDIEDAAAWLADRLRQIGVPEVEILPTAGSPAVYGRWHVADDRPTAMIYGHYDVQPADPLDLWQTPPFAPEIRDGRIYARGAADDKGSLYTAVTAVEALARTQGQPPINLIFFIEGEEEIGSPNLAAFAHEQRERLACDFVISADGTMYAPDQPSISIASKGLAGCQINLRTAGTDLHSGEYGASVPNAVQALVQLAASFHTPEGRVAVEGFYDRVPDLTPTEREEIEAVPFDASAFLRRIGAETFWGEPGYSVLERNWTRPTLDLNGIWGGFEGSGAKTVTPCEAHLKLTCRLVPNQEPGEILDLIERHVATHCPPGAIASIERFAGSARPFVIRRDHPALVTAERVLRDVTGKEPVVIRFGGTLPVAEMFQRELGADMVFFAWEMPDNGLHAPNEFFRLDDFRTARRAYCAYLQALGVKR